MKESAFYKEQARKLMENGWKNYALGFLVYFLIVMGVSFIPVAGSIAAIVVAGAFSLSFAMISLKFIKGEKVEMSNIFDGFSNFSGATVLYLFQNLIIFLWMLLLFVPGIIKSFEYSMTFYILSEKSDMTAKQAMAESKELMQGHKMELFKLNLSFIGWALLSVLTCGILMFWLIPYMNIATAVFYTDLKVAKYGNAHPYTNRFASQTPGANFVNPNYGNPVQSQNTGFTPGMGNNQPHFGAPAGNQMPNNPGNNFAPPPVQPRNTGFTPNPGNNQPPFGTPPAKPMQNNSTPNTPMPNNLGNGFPPPVQPQNTGFTPNMNNTLNNNQNNNNQQF